MLKCSSMRRYLCLAALMATVSGAIHAAEYGSTNKPIRLVVGYAPASGADVVARLLAIHLQQSFKGGVVVDNKPGAGGVLAAQEVMRAAPDGYTLMLAAMPQMAILPAINKVPYNAEKDFAPVSQVVGTDLVLVTNPERVPSSSMQEFASWAKKQPRVFFGTPGPGTVGHFGAYLLASAVNAKVEPVHFRSTGDQVTALLSGDIQAEFFSYGAAAPLVKAGKVKALITTSPTRSTMFPDVPTSSEAGYPSLIFTSWYGVFAPAGTPPQVIDKLNTEIVKATQSPDIRSKLEGAGLRVTGTGSEALAHLLKEDTKRWGEVIKSTGFSSQP